MSEPVDLRALQKSKASQVVGQASLPVMSCGLVGQASLPVMSGKMPDPPGHDFLDNRKAPRCYTRVERVALPK
jgi:hypothetical protein